MDWQRRLLAGRLLCLFENRGECLCVSADQADKTEIRYFESRKCGITLVFDNNLAVILQRTHLLKVSVEIDRIRKDVMIFESWKVDKLFFSWRLASVDNATPCNGGPQKNIPIITNSKSFIQHYSPFGYVDCRMALVLFKFSKQHREQTPTSHPVRVTVCVRGCL